MCRSSQGAAALVWSLAFVVLACAAPPNKEIGDAQQALNAARAAGAERFAPKPYEAAAEAYRLANQAVLAGDYRLALNRALESREHAQTAKRESSDIQNRVRDDVQRALADVATLLASAGSRIEDAERAHLPARVIREARQAVAQVNGDVQEASASIKAQDYASAQPLLARVKPHLEKAIASIDAAMPAQSRR
jgi:hypothetical protein